MDKIIGYIFETYDYDKFHKTKGNRGVGKKRFEDLTESIATHGYKLVPIVCDATLGILDGQGRYEACKSLNLPIRYVIDDTAKEVDCATLNQYNKKWVIRDFVNLHANNGNESAIRIRKLEKETGLGLSVLAETFLSSGSGGKFDSIKDGSVIVDDEQFRFVIETVKYGEKILGALLYEKKPSKVFWRAIAIICKHFDIDKDSFLENCKLQRNSYIQMAKVSDQLKEFSRIYNYRKKTRQIDFDEYSRSSGVYSRDYAKIADMLSKYNPINAQTLK